MSQVSLNESIKISTAICNNLIIVEITSRHWARRSEGLMNKYSKLLACLISRLRVWVRCLRFWMKGAAITCCCNRNLILVTLPAT
jgi:hypothetical protein